MFAVIAVVLITIPLLARHPEFSSADITSIPLTAPKPAVDQYEIRFAQTGGKVYVTEFEDSHGHHCVMGKYSDNIVLSCEGH